MRDGRPLPQVTLRRARATDAFLLRTWRNDVAAVRFSATSRPVSVAEHARWLEARLSDTATRLFIGEENGIPVGQVRIDEDGDVGTVSIAVAAGHRGRGLATSMLHALVEVIGGGGDVGRLRALVHPDNVASRHAFERAGFRRMPGDDNGFIVLEYRAQPHPGMGAPP